MSGKSFLCASWFCVQFISNLFPLYSTLHYQVYSPKNQQYTVWLSVSVQQKTTHQTEYFFSWKFLIIPNWWNFFCGQNFFIRAPLPEKCPYFVQYCSKIRELVTCGILWQNGWKKIQFSGVIFKYTKKIPFQYSAFDTFIFWKIQLSSFWENGEPIFRSGP